MAFETIRKIIREDWRIFMLLWLFGFAAAMFWAYKFLESAYAEKTAYMACNEKWMTRLESYACIKVDDIGKIDAQILTGMISADKNFTGGYRTNLTLLFNSSG